MRILDWNRLSSAQRREALQRPALEETARITAAARHILERLRREGDAAVLVAARKAGVEEILSLGGAQAIAAMAYGSESIPKCDKVLGPGNAYVTAAKILVAQAGGAALDLPAGVSEVMVIADEEARANFVAADLLAQAEHSPEAQAILLTTEPTRPTAGR